jgi:twinkle protein
MDGGMNAPRKIGAIFVTTDNPAFLERQVDPAQQVFSMAGSNVRSLLDEHRQKQQHYATGPFDPTGASLRFFPGGLTIWSGNPGAGKTTLLRQLACHLLRSPDPHNPLGGPGVFVCSMEEMPQDVLIRHAQVACGTENLTENMLQWCVDLWADKLKLWNYRPIEADCQYRKILAAIRILARDHGVRHAIIDSLMCLDVSSTDYDAQRIFAGELARTAQTTGMHIHLVAHPRKPARADQELDTADVAGSADLGRKADNVLFVQRDSNEAANGFNNCTPMWINVKKQRYGTGYVGQIRGWFHRGLRQFVATQFQETPTQYLTREAHQDFGQSGESYL